MKIIEWYNFLTGLFAFIIWALLSYKNPEYTLRISLASLLILLGFGGRDTIITLLELWTKMKSL